VKPISLSIVLTLRPDMKNYFLTPNISSQLAAIKKVIIKNSNDGHLIMAVFFLQFQPINHKT
jgi:hypothetical protein